jgi:large subunit ribosomal protein L29
MTREKTSRFREMTADEIRARVAELREELFNLRFRNTMKQLDNPLKIREGRREMARLLTVLKEKESAAR